MIALRPRRLIGIIVLAWAALHLADRILAGVLQCASAGSCPW